MTKKELELENKMLRDEVEHLRSLVLKMSQQPAPIVVSPPIVYQPPVDLTPQITWHTPWPYNQHYYITCETEAAVAE